jgi:cellobiose phosphorylase
VQETLEKILPHNDKWVEKRCEPYVMCNSYFPEETGYRYGHSGQSWRTATGAWLFKALIYYVFGLQPELEGLKLNPCLPPDWNICSIHKKFRAAEYHITYEQTREGACNEMTAIAVNGAPHGCALLPYEENGTYEVRVTLS